MRIISFDGRLGKDAQVLTATNGSKYLRFSVANNMYNKNEERTDWFDVTCYDNFIIEHRAKFLTKGTYVIVTGTIITEGKANNGGYWINNYVTASSVEIPKTGKSKEEPRTEETPTVSVYTAATPTQKTSSAPTPVPQEPIVRTPDPQYYYAKESENDDLPF